MWTQFFPRMFIISSLKSLYLNSKINYAQCLSFSTHVFRSSPPLFHYLCCLFFFGFIPKARLHLDNFSWDNTHQKVKFWHYMWIFFKYFHNCLVIRSYNFVNSSGPKHAHARSDWCFCRHFDWEIDASKGSADHCIST